MIQRADRSRVPTPAKPTDEEDEYFARLELERRRNFRDDRATRAAENNREHTLSVVRGRCPKCGAELIPVPSRGIELDKCSRCQGMWTEDAGFFGSIRRIFR